MALTDHYREAHVDLASIANAIRSAAKRIATPADSAAVRADLNRLSGKLMVHLKMEDDALYPRLRNHPDTDMQVLANQFAQEMGGIAKVFSQYNSRWTAAEINADTKGFAAQTDTVMAALLRRIQSENTQLYALADQKFG